MLEPVVNRVSNCVLLATAVAVVAISVEFGAGLHVCAQDTASPAPARPSFDDLKFMAGGWRGRGLEEHWSDAEGGHMIGMSRIEGGKMLEFMTIEADSAGALTMRIQHFKFKLERKGEVVAFNLIRSGNGEAVFEMPENDFPRRITYMASGKDGMKVRLEDATGRKKLEFELSRLP